MNPQSQTTGLGTPRPWQRQPDELPTDFTAFVAYLRLKGRRSHRTVAEATARKLGTIRRLSARFNWPGRVAAFESRLADATQAALDSVLHARPAASKSELEQLRAREFLLAHEVLQQSTHWLQRASDPRRRNVSLGQVCSLIALATKLGRLSAGMPTGDEPHRRKRREDMPGYWTGPSLEEALEKIYGAKSAAADSSDQNPAIPKVPNGEPAADMPGSVPPNEPPPLTNPSPINDMSHSQPRDLQPSSTTTIPAPPPTQQRARRDAWSEWARQQRGSRSA